LAVNSLLSQRAGSGCFARSGLAAWYLCGTLRCVVGAVFWVLRVFVERSECPVAVRSSLFAEPSRLFYGVMSFWRHERHNSRGLVNFARPHRPSLGGLFPSNQWGTSTSKKGLKDTRGTVVGLAFLKPLCLAHPKHPGWRYLSRASLGGSTSWGVVYVVRWSSGTQEKIYVRSILPIDVRPWKTLWSFFCSMHGDAERTNPKFRRCGRPRRGVVCGWMHIHVGGPLGASDGREERPRIKPLLVRPRRPIKLNNLCSKWSIPPFRGSKWMSCGLSNEHDCTVRGTAETPHVILRSISSSNGRNKCVDMRDQNNSIHDATDINLASSLVVI